MRLIELWQQDTAFVGGKSLQQIISFCGEGALRDDSDCASEFREFLGAVPLDVLQRLTEECLARSFPESGLALQDMVNEVGRRLGFEVQHGRYRGVKGAIGFDGLWRADDGHSIVLEVKTTDAYRMDLDTIGRYREALSDQGTIDEDSSSVLVAVGREDTGGLEAQIRGSRHAWDFRLVSIDSLLKLALVKERIDDWRVSAQINGILRPIEYTRLDGIVDLLFSTSKDIESAQIAEESPEEAATADTPEDPTRAHKLDHEAAKQDVLTRYAATLQSPIVKRGRALRATADGKHHIVCLASKPHYEGEGRQYWYGITPPQIEFLRRAPSSALVLACSDTHRAAAVPLGTIERLLPKLNTTPPGSHGSDDLAHWHIFLRVVGNAMRLEPKAGEDAVDVTASEIAAGSTRGSSTT